MYALNYRGHDSGIELLGTFQSKFTLAVCNHCNSALPLLCLGTAPLFLVFLIYTSTKNVLKLFNFAVPCLVAIFSTNSVIAVWNLFWVDADLYYIA